MQRGVQRQRPGGGVDDLVFGLLGELRPLSNGGRERLQTLQVGVIALAAWGALSFEAGKQNPEFVFTQQSV